MGYYKDQFSNRSSEDDSLKAAQLVAMSCSPELFKNAGVALETIEKALVSKEGVLTLDAHSSKINTRIPGFNSRQYIWLLGCFIRAVALT